MNNLAHQMVMKITLNAGLEPGLCLQQCFSTFMFQFPTFEKLSLPFILTVSDRRSTLPHTVNRPIFLLSILQLYECVITVEEHYHSASTRIWEVGGVQIYGKGKYGGHKYFCVLGKTERIVWGIQGPALQ